MGIIVSYNFTNNKEIINHIEKNKNSNFDIENFIRNEGEIETISCSVKSWNPLYTLLQKITSDNIFYKLSEFKSDKNFDEYTKIFFENEIEILFNILEKISIVKIKIYLDNQHLIKEISRIHGYNMDSIFDLESILLEFKELKSAVILAYKNNAVLIQILFP